MPGHGRSSRQLFGFDHYDAAAPGAFIAEAWQHLRAVDAANEEVTLWRTGHGCRLSSIVETYSKS
jgi:hypothetical protein